ncbi:MAG: DUF59 domain-containing protein [Alphaproteobacteria bacterium]|nr:DUF59 domain-containing protein [Alphaproteobacteria bacterium]
MNAKDEYSLQDAIADAVQQREAAGEMVMQPNPTQMAELERLSHQPVPPTREKLHATIIEALKTVFDPELPVNLYDLGLIYDIILDADNNVEIHMTLTAPGCPVAGEMPRMVEQAARFVNGVNKVSATLVWDPPWDKTMMSEAAQLELGFL